MISVIETHDLCKSYNGRIVVEHLNLSVPQGCVYGFLIRTVPENQQV